MKYPETNIESIGDFLEKLSTHIGAYGGPVWYRGHSIATWNLEPKLMRIHHRPPETHYLNKFKQDASMILNHQPKSEFEWLFLMQHYGVATRLLDWSESPLVGLYFALENNKDQDGALWVLLPCELNLKSNYRPDFEFEIPSFEDEHLRGYVPSTIAGESKSKLLPMAAIAPRNSARMQAQQGVFTISHRENIFIDQAGPDGAPKDHTWKYVIPQVNKQKLAKELVLLGFNRFQLFPELESLANKI
jgi:hypothetical protein